jgi:F-type H+-transporting ATPase subunit b
MDLVTPGVGLIFWATVTFLLLLVLLRKFAWKPILSMVKEREKSIEDALSAAKKAKEQMETLSANNEKIIAEARKEREQMLKEAREIKDKIIAEAAGAAKEEGRKLLEQARQNIEIEKSAAIVEIKNQVANLSVEIAEKILRKELSNDAKQKELIETMIKDAKLN